MKSYFFFFFSLFALSVSATIQLGIDLLSEERMASFLRGKNVGLVMNHTSVDSQMRSLVYVLKHYHLDTFVRAIFSPEHGLKGNYYAAESVGSESMEGIRVYSLHGDTRRPTKEMLQGIDLIIYDIQCIGNRPYTYQTTLFYVMEEAAKLNIDVLVLDRPNPINGITVDGPMLEDKMRSYIGYINVPYCHGMTIAELARFFNGEYQIGCKLQVLKMQGWKRSMNYKQTQLQWIPPSPNIAEPDTPLFCSITGALGELSLVNIGIGCPLPFKIVGAPWIKASLFAEKLNAQKLKGVYFFPFYFRPFWGLYKGLDCGGVLIQITDATRVQPLAAQCLLLGMLKSLYSKEVEKILKESKQSQIDCFCKALGSSKLYDIFLNEKYPAWKLMAFHLDERKKFFEIRKKYLLDYLD